MKPRDFSPDAFAALETDMMTRRRFLATSGAFIVGFSTRQQRAGTQGVALGFNGPFTTITGGIFEPGFPDCFQQMWAAYAAERAAALGNKFGCVTPDEAVLSHKVFAAALKSHASKTAVPID